MRIALILLSILAMIFIGSVTWSLVGQEGWTVKTRSSTPQNVDSITIETWKNQIKTEEKIEKLSAMVAELAEKNNTNPPENVIKSGTGNTEITKISGKLLGLLMPTITLTLVENNGIFGLYVFDQSIAYSTYTDDAYGLRIIPMNVSYDVFLKNARAFGGNPYTVNETKTFSFRSFYLNPKPSDTLVRLVVEMESQTLALEIPKTKYTILKGLLLGKTPIPNTPEKKN